MGLTMKKLYLFALEKERDAFLKGLDNTPTPVGDFFIDDHDAYAVIGVGKVYASMYTEKWIAHYRPDLVINVGVAGGIDLATDDWVLVTEAVFYDVDVTAFGYQKGQYPKASPIFKSDGAALDQLKTSLSPHIYHLGRIATGDTFMTNQALLNDDEAIKAVDMELAAIALVCETHQIPWVSIKTISDTVGTASQIEDFDHWVEEGLKKIAPLIKGAFS